MQDDHRVCRGPCGRSLPAGAFERRSGGRRRATCRRCHAGLAPLDDRMGQDPAGLVARYEALRRQYAARQIRWDDETFADLRDGVEAFVRRHGALVGAGVQYGWDWVEQSVRRAVLAN